MGAQGGECLLFLSLRVYFRIAIYLFEGQSGTLCFLYLCKKNFLPDVLEMRNRALVRLASPSMLRVPMNDVLIVLTALNW